MHLVSFVKVIENNNLLVLLHFPSLLFSCFFVSLEVSLLFNQYSNQLPLYYLNKQTLWFWPEQFAFVEFESGGQFPIYLTLEYPTFCIKNRPNSH